MATIRKKYPRGTTVTITATPKQGKRFDHWYAQTGTPFKGGTSPMTSENPVQITMNSKYRIQAFFETIPNTNTPRFGVISNKEDLVYHLKHYVPVPNYDIVMNPNKESEGIQSYHKDGNYTRGQQVNDDAYGIAFSPYLYRALLGGKTLTTSFVVNNELDNNYKAALAVGIGGAIDQTYIHWDINAIENNPSVTEVTGEDSSDTLEEWQMDRLKYAVGFYINGVRISELEDKTKLGVITYTFNDGSSVIEATTLVIKDDNENPNPSDYGLTNFNDYDFVTNLKYLWQNNDVEGFYLHDNIVADPNSVTYNN